MEPDLVVQFLSESFFKKWLLILACLFVYFPLHTKTIT